MRQNTNQHIASTHLFFVEPDLAPPAHKHRIELCGDLLHAFANALAKIARALEVFHVHSCKQRAGFVGKPLQVGVIRHVPEIERIEEIEQIRYGALMEANRLPLVRGLQAFRQMLDELGKCGSHDLLRFFGGIRQ
jgi:hypothetical protein